MDERELPIVESSNILQRLHPVAFVLLALGAVFILYQLVAGGLTLLIAGVEITDDNVNVVRWSTLVGQFGFILLPTLLLTWLRHGRIREPLRLRLPSLPEVVVAIVAIFALQQILQGYMLLQDSIPLPTKVRDFFEIVKRMFEQAYRVLLTAHNPAEFILVVVTVALVPSIAEELLFRGLVQRNLDTIAGGLRSAVVTGIVFGMYHLNPFSFVALGALGIFLGFLVYRSQNTLVAVVAHFFNNFIACAAVYLNYDEEFLVVAPTGGATAESVAMNSAMFGVVFVAAMFYFVKLTQRSTTT